MFKFHHPSFLRSVPFFSTAVLCTLAPGAFAAAEGVSPSADGNNAWMLTSTALVLFMTIPGLALFYGGLVNRRNVLSVLMQCFSLAAVLSLVWLVLGYSMSMGKLGGISGGMSAFLHQGVGPDKILASAFQMTFFIITPALIIGTFVERIKFSSMLVFSVIWSLLVYAPVCHVTWFGGFFQQMGVVDLAGGIVVHITAGVAALVACLMVGKRHKPEPPHNLPMTVTGTAMLWVGWFGFNAGSQGGATNEAAMTLFVTHISASAAACTWAVIEWFINRKPSVLGTVTGAVAGLAAITPASGVAGPAGAMLIGIVSAFVCWWASVRLKNRFRYDDSLDVAGVHGVGGIVGTLLVSIVGLKAFGGFGNFEFFKQFGLQLMATVLTILYTAAVTYAILVVIRSKMGLRVSATDETLGLDEVSHGESAYNDII